MTSPIASSARTHETLAVLEAAKQPRPKPTREGRRKMVKSPILPPKVKKRVPVAKQRKKLENQIIELVKLIVCWRDSQQCVFQAMDGGRCGNGLMWNHFIGQKQSHWLQIDLGNVVWGCGNHNLLDFRGSKIFPVWYAKTFGVEVLEAMEREARIHIGQKRALHELEAILAHYEQLYQDRFYVNADIPSLIAAGYYGSVVKAALSHSIPAMAEKETEAA